MNFFKVVNLLLIAALVVSLTASVLNWQHAIRYAGHTTFGFLALVSAFDQAMWWPSRWLYGVAGFLLLTFGVLGLINGPVSGL